MRQDQNETGSGHDCKGDANAGATSRNQKARTHDTGPDVRGRGNPGAVEVMTKMKHPLPSKMMRYGILSPYGNIWTIDTFDSAAEANRHLKKVFHGVVGDINTFKIIAVEVTVKTVEPKQRKRILRDALLHYACPGKGDCSTDTLKDGSCIRDSFFGECGDVAAQALKLTATRRNQND